MLGAALLLLSGWETSKSIALTESRIEPSDVREMRQMLSEVQVPVLAHRDWLEPQLRRWFPQAAKPSAFARPDADELAEFWTLGHRSDPPTQTIARNAQLKAQVQHGELVARNWMQPQTFVSLAKLGPSSLGIQDLHVRVDQGSCKIETKDPLKVRCPDQSSLTWEVSEVSYRARACLALRSPQLGPVTLSFKLSEPRALHRIQGHVGYSDFNARLRSDAALQVLLRADHQELLRQTFSDAQGWAEFSVAIPEPFELDPTFHLTLLVNASQARSTGLRRPVIPCIELRFQRLEAPSP